MKIVSLIVLWSMMLVQGNSIPDVMTLDQMNHWINSSELPEIEIIEVTEEVVEEDIYMNELGEVPIMLYHRIVESDQDYDTSPDEFLMNIEKLYANDFVLIDLLDYLEGIIDIPKGKHPVVITFDDGATSQFRLIKEDDGNYQLDKQSAIGILHDFYLEHPDFGFEVTFFLNGNIPFGQNEVAQDKLDFLKNSGLTIGNHTISHKNFTEMGANDEILNSVYDNESYYLNKYNVELGKILAVPFGEYPNDFSSIEQLGYYTFKVGWKPEVSVFSTSFNPYKINRVQNGNEDFQFEYWIDHLISHPEKVFTSDGEIDKITVPRGSEGQIDKERFKNYEIIINEVE